MYFGTYQIPGIHPVSRRELDTLTSEIPPAQPGLFARLRAWLVSLFH